MQQKLAYNQSLQTLELQKLNGTPEKFPLFKQCFKHTMMSQEDIDDDSKMTHPLQFLDGEANKAVSGLKTVTGGVQQAL